ncbi:MAG TPA: signal peptidase I [Opitutaceae bacterium]|jgi:signal peptidase I
MNRSLKSFLLRHWRELRPVIIALAIAAPLRSAVADWNVVPTGSMEPTIVPAEYVWVDKLAYDLKVPFTTEHLATWGNPSRGDVIVFYSPADGTRLVKRVVGLPGDTVESRMDRLCINGAPLDYAPWHTSRAVTADRDGQPRILAQEGLPGRPHPITVLPARRARRNFGPVRVPAGSYFVMGDNRDNSFDSRYFGAVSRDRIVGRATRVIASFDLSHLARPRFDRFLSPLQ